MTILRFIVVIREKNGNECHFCIATQHHSAKVILPHWSYLKMMQNVNSAKGYFDCGCGFDADDVTQTIKNEFFMHTNFFFEHSTHTNLHLKSKRCSEIVSSSFNHLLLDNKNIV